MAIEGYIFGCGDDTTDEIFSRGLFGLPHKYRLQVESIRTGTPLYLFHFHQRRLLGGFEAADHGGFAIVPEAFGGRFPCQVRFRVKHELQAPISEHQFENILGNNYFDCKRFSFCLDREQVAQLDEILGWEAGYYQEQEDFEGNETVKVEYPGEFQMEMPGDVADSCSPLDGSVPDAPRGYNRVIGTHKLSLSRLKALFNPAQSTQEIDRKILELGREERTTIYVGPFPGGSSFSAGGIVKILSRNHRGKYNFMFVEHGHDDFRHCFLNMESPEDVLSVVDELHMRSWPSLIGKARDEDMFIMVAFWEQQGIEALAKLFHAEGYWHSGGASTCKELYDNRALFFYGAGAKFACRNVPLYSPGNLDLREAGVTPMSAFLNGWPDFGSADESTKDYKPLEAEILFDKASRASASQKITELY